MTSRTLHPVLAIQDRENIHQLDCVQHRATKMVSGWSTCSAAGLKGIGLVQSGEEQALGRPGSFQYQQEGCQKD